MSAIKIIYVYCDEDESLLKQLEKHLRSLSRQGQITTWHRGKVAPGQELDAQIHIQLNEAHIILLLVSPDFMDSKYSDDDEIQRILEQHHTRKVPVIPVILQPVIWEGSLFGKFSPLPKNRQPVTTWNNRDLAFVDIVQGIQETIEELKKTQPVRPSDQILRSFVWVHIPAGDVTLHTRSAWAPDYVPADSSRPYTIGSAFKIMKYPVTNGQFEFFIDDGGYSTDRWWTPEGLQMRRAGGWQAPFNWEIQRSRGKNLPVCGVSWFEAVAYCRWYSEVTGEKASLPTELQWQRAAQGDSHALFPWGDEFDRARCTFDAFGPYPVMKYEKKGLSPFGVADLSGNVWEWCVTKYETGQSDLNGMDHRVIRGGCWADDDSDFLQVICRRKLFPTTRDVYYGFRMVGET